MAKHEMKKDKNKRVNKNTETKNNFIDRDNIDYFPERPFYNDLMTTIDTVNKQLDSPVLDDLKKYIKNTTQELPSNIPPHLATSVPSLWNIVPYPIILNPDPISASTYQRIASESIVRGMLRDALSIDMAGIGAYKHTNQEVQKVVRFALDNLKGGFHAEAEKMLSNMYITGSFTAQKTPTLKLLGSRPVWLVGEIIHLPSSSKVLTADFSGRLYQIYQWYAMNGIPPGYQNANYYGAYGGYGGAGIDNANNYGYEGSYVDPFANRGAYDYPLRTPVTQFMCLTEFKMEEIMHGTLGEIGDLSNLYGQSTLQPIYPLWLQENAQTDILLPAIQRRVLPLIIAYVAAQRQARLPNGRVVDLVEQVRRELINAPSAGATVFQGRKGEMYELDVLDTTADFGIFPELRKMLHEEMAYLIGVPPVAADKNSYAAGYQLDTRFGRIRANNRKKLCHILIQQLVRDIIEKNFLPSEYEDYGYFETMLLTQDERLKEIQIAKEAAAANFIRDGNNDELLDCNVIREKLGFDYTEEKINNQTAELQKASMTNREVGDSTNKPYAHHDEPADAVK